MKSIKSKHYVDTVIYSIDMIIRNLKIELKKQIDSLNMGITSEQFIVLDTIYCYKNIYQQKLSEILCKDKSNTMRILSVLTDKNLITKDVSKVNNRLVNILKITEEGKNLVDKYMPTVKNILKDKCLNISDEDVDNLHVLSQKFQNKLTINIK